MQLEVGTGSPLLVRHLEQINLRDCPGDIQQRINPAETIKSGVDNRFGGFNVA